MELFRSVYPLRQVAEKPALRTSDLCQLNRYDFPDGW
jgi:hypothetical protein